MAACCLLTADPCLALHAACISLTIAQMSETIGCLAACTAESFCTVRLQTVPENQRKPATVRGLCISRNNRGVRTTFTLRNFLGNAGGIERTFPL